MEKKRIGTVKTRIHDIATGNYVAQEGFSPNYVLTNRGERLSRVRILGTVVDKFVSESGKFASVTVDDGTDTIRVKVFNALSIFDKIGAGSDVDIVARVKKYQDEIYLAPEIVTENDDPNIEILRELEIRAGQKKFDEKKRIVLEHKSQASDVAELQRIMNERFSIRPEEVEAMLNVGDAPEMPGDKSRESVLELVEKLDKGSGCDYTELIKASGLPEDVIDSVVNDLLSEGTCFEPRPGKIKKL